MEYCRCLWNRKECIRTFYKYFWNEIEGSIEAFYFPNFEKFWKIRNRVLNNIFCFIEIYEIYNIKLLKNVIAMSKKFQKIKKVKKFFSLF